MLYVYKRRANGKRKYFYLPLDGMWFVIFGNKIIWPKPVG